MSRRSCLPSSEPIPVPASRPRNRAPRFLAWPVARWVLLAALTFGVAPSGWGAETEPRAAPADSPETSPLREEFLKVNYAFNRGLFELCIPRYERLLDADPPPSLAPQVQYALALCHYNLALAATAPPAPSELPGRGPARAAPPAAAADHLKKAVDLLTTCIRSREFDARLPATLTLAQVLLVQEEAASAAKTFQWVLDRKPDEATRAAAILGLADAHYRAGDYAAAAAAYREALKTPAVTDRDRAELFLGLSLYRRLAEDGFRDADLLEECRGALDRAARRAESPHAVDALYMSAMLLQETGDVDGAARRFEELAASGKGARAELGRFGMASTLARAGRHAEAAAAWRRFLEDYPQAERGDTARLYLARSLVATGETDEARALLSRLTRSPSAISEEAALSLSRLLRGEGRWDEVAELLEPMLRRSDEGPRRAAIELELVTARIEGGDVDEALAALKRLRSDGRAAADQVDYLAAFALHRAGRHDEALQACSAFQEAHARSAFLSDVLQLRAESLFLSGDAAGAYDAYGVLERDVSDALEPRALARARFRMAQCLYLQERYEEASRVLRSSPPPAAETPGAPPPDPLLASYHFLLGDCAYQLKDYASAARELQAFLEGAGDGRGGDGRDRGGLEDQLRDARFKRAHALQLSGDEPAALEAYATALRSDPQSPHRAQIYFELGQIAYARGEHGSARNAFEAVLRESPGPRIAAHALRFLGWLAFQEGRHAEAAESYRRIVRDYPESPLVADAEFELAASLQASGLDDEARAVLRDFAERHPDDPRLAQVRLREAETYSRDGQYEEALRILEELRSSEEARSLRPRVLYELAWCHRGLGDVAKAVDLYRRILDSGDAGDLHGTIALELAELEFEAGSYEATKRLLAPLVRLEGEEGEKSLYRLCWTHHRLDDPKSVAATYRSFASRYPESDALAELCLLAAKAHTALGEHEQAQALFETLESRPGASEEKLAALLGHAEMLVELRKFREAKEKFQAFLADHSTSSLAYRARFGVGWADENLGALEDAISSYRQVVRATSTPTGARAQFQIGQCLAAQERYGDAVVEFLQVPAAFAYPEWSSRALLQAAGCFETLGDTANAKKHYREVSETFGGRDEAKLAAERLAKLEREG